MEIEEGMVIETQGQVATIRVNKASSCAHCKAGCMEQGGFMITKGENSIGAKVGDTVLLNINSRMALNSSLIVFGLPLIALLLGVFIAHAIAVGIGYEDHSQLISISGGAILFILSFIPIKMYDKRVSESEKSNVHIISVINHQTE
jgi:sigma-E factor negative regulatory protein RseC